MKKNKLFSGLMSLSQDEFYRFGKFLRSPYFNTSESNIRLFIYLKRFYPLFDDTELTKDNICKAIYGNKPYEDKKLRDRFTHLLSQLKTFLAVEKYHSDNFDFKKNLIVALNEKGLLNMLEAEFQSALSFVEKAKFKDEHYYLNKYLLEVVRREAGELNIQVSQREELYSDVKNEIDDAIHFFLIVMLKEYSILSNTARHVNIDHKFKFFENIINYLSNEEEHYKNIILINVFYTFFQVYQKESNYSLIGKIREVLIVNREQIKESNFKMLFIELYNHCKRRQSAGEKEFGTISFELIYEMLQRDVFLRDDGTMSAHTYINLASSGLREHNIEWAEKFIIEYQYKLPPEDKENAFNYNCAVLHYMKGSKKVFCEKERCYTIALTYLNKVKSEDFYYMTRIKNHYLKIFYELNHLESAMSLIDSYYHYLSRNPNIPERLAERYRNFISFLQRLIRLRMKPDLFCLEKLNTEIFNNSKTEYKGWLSERIKDLLGIQTSSKKNVLTS